MARGGPAALLAVLVLVLAIEVVSSIAWSRYTGPVPTRSRWGSTREVTLLRS
jgi:hypothetical protein